MSNSKIDYKTIGRRIKAAREAKRLSQGELGAKLSKPVTATAISLYEKGERDAPLDVLAEIGKTLDVSLEILIDGYKDAPPIHVALRSDPQLQDNAEAQEQIMDFIEFVKIKSRKK